MTQHDNTAQFDDDTRLRFETGTWIHEPTGTEQTTYHAISQVGDRYLIHPPNGSLSREWHVIAERNYTALGETATERLPQDFLPSGYGLTSAIAHAQRDADRRIRERAIEDGIASVNAPWVEKHIEFRTQRLNKNDDGTQTWEDMYPLETTTDPTREARLYATNPYRRVVRVEVAQTFTPLVVVEADDNIDPNGPGFYISATEHPATGDTPYAGSNDLK